MSGLPNLSTSLRQRPYSIRTRIKTGWCCCSGSQRGQRPYSIRTRIKTKPCRRHDSRLLCQRPYSIRTRIKTKWIYYAMLILDRQRPYSIRTRIKTFTLQINWSENQGVRDHIPLEQGLRQTTTGRGSLSSAVRDHIPLEQGLRRAVLSQKVLRCLGQRPYSIRTRIKTPCPWQYSQGQHRQRPYSIRTRIKTITVFILSPLS